MASTFSTNLALELIGTGDQAGTWGNTTNTNLGTLIEQAISGYVTQAVTTGNTTTLTIPDGASGVARNMYIELTGTGGSNTFVEVPAKRKLYFIYNNTTGAVTVRVSGQTGVSVAASEKKILVNNGTDIVEATSYLTAINSSLTLSTLSVASLTISSGTANGVLYLNASKAATSGSALVFDGTNLGIGISPDERLTVTATNPTDGRVASLRNNATSSLTGTKLWFNQATVDNWNIGQPAGVNAFVFCNSTGSANERMRLDAAGNLGLGVTPSAWGTIKAFQVFNGSIAGSPNNNILYQFGNAYYDGSSFRYIASDYAAQYRINDTGQHLWYTAPSGTAGNAITFTQAMTLDADGRLIVGATSAAGANFFTVERNSTTLPCYANITGGSAETSIANLDPGALITLKNLNTTNNTYTMIRGTSTNGTTNNAIFFVRESNSTHAGSIAFGTTNSSGTFAERARITATGNLLVGTTTDVSGRSGVISDAAGNVRDIPSAGAAKTSEYTLTISDIGEFVTIGTSGKVLIPNNTFATGNAISVYNDTTGNVSLNISTTTGYVVGTNTNRTGVTLATRGIANILFINPSYCILSGNLT